MMNRTTIMLPSTLKMQVMKLAKSEGVSLGGLIRKLLESKLQMAKQIKTKAQDPFFADTSVFTGNAATNLASNHDDYLY